jgi:hypothetical protein
MVGAVKSIKDKYGQEVHVGDYVVFCPPNSHDDLRIAKVLSHGEKQVSVEYDRYGDGRMVKAKRSSFIKLNSTAMDEVVNGGRGKFEFVSDELLDEVMSEASALPE